MFNSVSIVELGHILAFVVLIISICFVDILFWGPKALVDALWPYALVSIGSLHQPHDSNYYLHIQFEWYLLLLFVIVACCDSSKRGNKI